MTLSYLWHDLPTIYRWDTQNDDQIWYFKFCKHNWLQTSPFYQISYINKRILLMISLWLSRDLATFYRNTIKWGPDLVSQLLHAQLTSNFVRYVRLTKNFINGNIMTVTWPISVYIQDLLSQVLAYCACIDYPKLGNGSTNCRFY